MLFYLTSRIVSSVAAFLYPGYASYKTLSQRPASEDDLERWLMYWSVLGCIVGVEYVAEWLVSWIPFYYPIKTIFLLYLALPQTRGSSYLYVNHLQPFFHSHESQIDAALASFKVRVYTFLQERLRALWEHVATTVGQQQQRPTLDPASINTAAPPTLGDPVSGPAQLIYSLWRSHGPSIIASGNALLRQSATTVIPAADRATLNSPAASPPAPPSYVRADTSQSVLERRRQLEAELAALQKAADPDPVSVPVPAASPSFSQSRTSSESDLHLRERTAGSGGKFEEIEVPSDAEGYDVGGSGIGSKDDRGSVREAGNQRRGSWFGWGGSPGGSKGGYERVKND